MKMAERWTPKLSIGLLATTIMAFHCMTHFAISIDQYEKHFVYEAVHSYSVHTESEFKKVISCARQCAQMGSGCERFKCTDDNESNCCYSNIDANDNDYLLTYRSVGECSRLALPDFTEVEINSQKYCLGVFVLQPSTYDEALAHCHSIGTRLLHPNAMDKYTAILSIINQKELYALTSNTDTLWVGANDLDVEGVWRYEFDGTLIDNDNFPWSVGQPKAQNADDNCAAFQPKDVSMYDRMCSRQLGFVCEA